MGYSDFVQNLPFYKIGSFGSWFGEFGMAQTPPEGTPTPVIHKGLYGQRIDGTLVASDAPYSSAKIRGGELNIGRGKLVIAGTFSPKKLSINGSGSQTVNVGGDVYLKKFHDALNPKITKLFVDASIVIDEC